MDRRATCLTTARASRNGSVVIRMESATKNVPIASRTHGAKMSNFGTREGRRGRGWMSARRPSGRRCRRGGHRNTRETRGDARRDDSGEHIVERFRRRASFRGSRIASESTNLRQRILVRFAARLREREAPRALIPQSRARGDRPHAYGGRHRGPRRDRDRRRGHPPPSLSSQRDDQCRHEKPNVAKKQIAARPVADLLG